MVVMTIAQVVPLIAYSIYRAAIRMSDSGKKNRSAAFVVAIGAYAVYIVSELSVLWFSRLREYYADQYAGERTNNPASLASALVRIGYGLASGAGSASSHNESARRSAGLSTGALGALNIFDRKASLGLVVATSGASSSSSDSERVKDALQWDLWIPWALYY
jgi:Zn-dependent protease with chaperone function